MRLSAFTYLLRLSFQARWKAWFWVVLGMALGVLSLTLALLMGLGFGRSLDRYINRIFPENRILLRPKSLEVTWLQVQTAIITPETLEKVRAVPGVRRLSPEATLRFPASAEADLLGNRYRTDISVTGIEPWLLGEEAPTSFTYNMEEGGEVPAVLARYFLDLYNMTLAESNGLPKLSRQAAIGRHFVLHLGVSSIRSQPIYGKEDKVASVHCRIVALSRNPELLGLLIPLEAVEQMNAWYGLTEKHYQAIHVEVETPEAIDRIKARLGDWQLEIHDPSQTWRRALTFVDLLGLGFLLFGALVFALALAYMLASLSAMLMKRRRERALFQALGASPGQLSSLVLAEMALVTAIGIALGAGLSAWAYHSANGWYLSWRADRHYLPELLFQAPLWWLAVTALASWGLCLCLGWVKLLGEARHVLNQALSRHE